jgi:Putative Flp pilus-assembly TadE/G-like
MACKKPMPTGYNHWFERGQALVLTLVFIASAGLVSLLLFNSGMLANSKTRLQNAADASAYSAGVLQARDHNFSAYTNRAMVANQASVAQVISLKSFIEDAADTGNRMGGALLSTQRSIFPSFAPAWDGVKNTTVPIVKNINSTFGGSSGVASAMVKYLDALILIFETAQTVHHAATIADMVMVSEEVLKKNDPEAKLSSGMFAAGNLATKVTAWAGSTQQHRANDTSAQADRFADLVVSRDATDRFTRNRASVPTPFWISTVKVCPGSIFSLTTFNFTHAGGTQLSTNKKRWLALDATQGGGGWLCVYTCGPFVCPIGSPLTDGVGGSGGGLAGTSGGYGSTKGYKNNPSETIMYGMALVIAPAPAAIRYFSKGPGGTLDSSGGLQDNYRDVSNPTVKAKNQSPEENGGAFPVTLEAERPASSIRTSSKLLTNSTLIKMDDQLASGNMRAMASAHSYFYRSKTNSGFTSASWARSDGRTEIENLFNPYWQSRLIDISQAERLGSVVEQTN